MLNRLRGSSITMGEALDEAGRPHAPRRAADVTITTQGKIGQQTLVRIHRHLRDELTQIQQAVRAVSDGHSDAATARALINQLTMRQNYWSLGAFCAAYCRVLGMHHTIEDEHLFTSLRRADADLSPVLDRLEAEHEVIAGILTRLDSALVALVDGSGGTARLQEVVTLLAETLTSHLDYEEGELLEPIGRLAIAV